MQQRGVMLVCKIDVNEQAACWPIPIGMDASVQVLYIRTPAVSTLTCMHAASAWPPWLPTGVQIDRSRLLASSARASTRTWGRRGRRAAMANNKLARAMQATRRGPAGRPALWWLVTTSAFGTASAQRPAPPLPTSVFGRACAWPHPLRPSGWGCKTVQKPLNRFLFLHLNTKTSESGKTRHENEHQLTEY